MATPLAKLPVSNTRNLPVALELLRSSGASSDELTALMAAGNRVELAWASSLRPEWMIRLAWLLGVDRRALILVLIEALAAASERLEVPAALDELLELLPAWATGEVETATLLATLEPLAELADLEEDPRHPAVHTLLCWAGQLVAWSADAAEQTDLKRWHLARVGGSLAERTVPATPTLPELMHEGADHAAAALRFCCDAAGSAEPVGAEGLPPSGAEPDAGDTVPWTPRALASRRAADALRRLLPPGELLRRLGAARLSPSVNWHE